MILVMNKIGIMIVIVIILIRGVIGDTCQMGLRNKKPPTFDGDVKKREDADAWILGLNKFFKFHEYIDNMKPRIAI